MGVFQRILIFLIMATLLAAAPSFSATPQRNYDEEAGDIKEQAARNARLLAALKKMERAKDGMRLPVSRLPSIWPTHGVITSLFGMRRSPFSGKMRFHSGVDVGAPAGTPIRAPAKGIVVHAGKDGGYGNSVEIWHGKGVVTRHAHMSKVLATKGTRVRRGDIIGLVGSTGRSTGPHLHYEVIVGGIPTNPLRHVTDPR